MNGFIFNLTWHSSKIESLADEGNINLETCTTIQHKIKYMLYKFMDNTL